jgi:glycosyltransferase involved in cell wall biosynthesis
MTPSPERPPRLSVLIITLNEEQTLGRALESVSWADEIVVLDSGSTDGTESVARRFGASFHVHPYLGEGDQRRRSLELSSGDWVLYIDADEVVTPPLAAEIRAALLAPRGRVGYRMQIHTRFLGTWFGTRGWRREWKIRLFDRAHGRFRPVAVHSGAIVDGPIGTLKGAIHHFPYRDLAHFVAKMNSYSSRSLVELGPRARRVGPAGALARGVARFLRDYIAGGDFLYGRAGLVRSTVTGYYTFLKYAKVWEAGIHDHQTRPNVRDDS